MSEEQPFELYDFNALLSGVMKVTSLPRPMEQLVTFNTLQCVDCVLAIFFFVNFAINIQTTEIDPTSHIRYSLVD
jgi:hypothetical protein